MKKILRTVSVIVSLMLIFAVSVVPAEAAKIGFSGKRTVTLMGDRSDVENYVNGGRSELEIVIRQSKPEWLSYSTKSVDHSVRLIIEFEFSSYDEYVSRLTELLGQEPAIIYTSGKNFRLCESFESIDLINCFDSYFSGAGITRDLTLKEIFGVSGGVLTVNGTDYPAEARIDIGSSDEIVKFRSLAFETTAKDDGYKRVITAELEKNALLPKIKSNCMTAGAVCRNEGDRVEISFSAAGSQDLIRKTLLTVGVISSINEKDGYYDKNNVSVNYSEFIDASGVLTEGGNLTVSMVPNGDWDHVTVYKDGEGFEQSSSEPIFVEGTETELDFSYVIPFRFESVTVTTDLSAKSRRIERSVDFTVPTELSVKYHELLCRKLEDRLERGMKLTVYDNVGLRHYCFSFSSFFEDDLEEMTEAAINGECELGINLHVLPLLKSKVSDGITLSDSGKYSSAKTVMYRFIVPKRAKCSGYSRLMGTENGKSVYEVTASAMEKSPFCLRCANWVFTLIILGAVLIAALTVLIIIKKIKKSRKKKIAS